MSYLAPQIGKYFENLDDIDHFTIASYCRDVINSLEKILDLSLLNSENRNPRLSNSWLSAVRDLTRDYMFSPKMTASSTKSRSVNISSPNDAPGALSQPCDPSTIPYRR